MADVILTQDEFNRLKAVVDAANELLVAIPYVGIAGGTLTSQHIKVAALKRAVDAAAGIEGRELEHAGDAKSSGARAATNRRSRNSS